MRSIPLLCAAATLVATPALALDLNSFRAQHKLPPLAMSSTLAGLAASHAQDMASRRRLDHKGFRARARRAGSAMAQNVAFGCASEDCVFRMWSRSAGHRRNMLLRGVSAYGLASAVAANGRRYWVLELGNQ